MVLKKMKAVVTVGDGTLEVKEIDVPHPGPGQILVKVMAAAQNPADWKSTTWFKIKDRVPGCDISGVVQEIGPDVPRGLRKVGERVACFLHGSLSLNGGFSEYIVTDARIVISIPDSWSFAQAAQLPVASYTASQCLYQAHSFPTPLRPTSTLTDILVWSGTSAVGQYVVQFAKQAGLRVISTGSKKNLDFVRSLGADDVFDYADPETPSRIKALTGGKLKYAVDCISEGMTPDAVSNCMSDDGAVVSVLLPYKSRKPGVQVRHLVAYALLGKSFTIPIKWEASPTDYERGVKFSKLISEILATGKIKPGPMILMPNGLASVKDGIEYMREGKVSAAKLTYFVGQTHGIIAERS